MTAIHLVKDDIQADTYKLNPNGRKIFIDRYAKKDNQVVPQIGQLVVVTPDESKAARELATVKHSFVDAKQGDMVEVVFENDHTQTFRLDQIDIPVELEPEQMHLRVANAIASVEGSEELRAQWENEFYGLLRDWCSIPGGRVLASAGTGVETTAFNCYVQPAPHDSRNMTKYRLHNICTDDWALRDGIDETLSRMTETMARGGGVGIPIHTLRPRDAYVKGVNGRSSGSVSWAEEFSRRTGKIEQGGSRRGALMIAHAIWHPDIIQFINCKREDGFAENCNISVAITDKFMKAVEQDGEWNLVFPDTAVEQYDAEWDGDIDGWRAKGYPIKIYKTLKARDLWRMIAESAWSSGEPGVLFIDRYNKMSNTWYYPEGRIYCTNPCGEQGLPGNAVCNLIHQNLPRYLRDTSKTYRYVVPDEDDAKGLVFECKGVDLAKLAKDVTSAVRFADNVIDYTYYFDPRNATQQQNERRVGLGTLGLGELLMRLSIEYGGEPSYPVINAIYGTIACAAYDASVRLAEERGSFRWFRADKFVQSGFVQQLPHAIRARIKKYGIRNATLLTEAPTGTLGTMVQTTTGIEPAPWLVWTRNSRVGTMLESSGPFIEWYRDNIGDPNELLNHPNLSQHLDNMWKEGKIPRHFITATWMSPETHAKTQAAIQRWTDSSISKTSNLPETYTVEQVSAYYDLIYKLGCKGGTVYRQNSRSQAVLSQKGASKKDKGADDAKWDLRPLDNDAGKSLWAKTETPVGTVTTFMRLSEDNKPFDLFNMCGKTGTDVMADQEAIGRMMSLLMRANSPLEPLRRMELISEALHGIGGSSAVGFGPTRVTSIADGVAHNIDKLVGAVKAKKWNGNGHKQKDLCPSCHGATLEHGAGCATCTSCGYSKC